MMEPRGRRLAARRAHHLERAGDRDAAIDAWLRAAAWLHEVDQRQALRVTEHAALLLEDSPEDDPRRDRLLYTRGRSLAFQGRPDDAGALADTLLERGRRRDSPATEGCGHLLWAILHRIAWDASGAVEAAERALACMLRLEVPENRVAEAWAELGFARFSGGDFVGAEDAFRHSGHTAFIPPMKVQADLLRSHCYHQLGDVARARRVLERTASRIPSGSDLMRGGVEIIAAELERHEGRTDEARRRVLAAIAATERRYRVPQARVVGLLAELWIDAGRPDEARRVLEQYDQPGRRDALEWASAEALVAAVSSDAQALDDVLTCIETDRSSQAVIAIARRLERTADRALGLDRELAARAGRLAVAAWERAHRTSDAKRVRAALWATGLGQGRPVG